MEAAGVDKKSTSKNGAVKKIFRARKTMNASCRQQIATFNKLKNTSKTETFVKESPVLPKENVQEKKTKVLVDNCIAQNNTSSEKKIHLSQSFSSNGFKPSAKVSPECRNGNSLGEMWEEWSKACENSACDIQTFTGNSANVSDVAHDVNSAIHSTEKTEVIKRSSGSSTSSGIVQSRILTSDSLQDIEKAALSNIDICSSVSDKNSDSSNLRTVNEDSISKINSATGLLTPLGIVDTDSTSAAVPSNESSASCDTTGTSNSLLPNFTVNLHVESAAGNLSQGCNIISGECQKKRFFSGDAAVPEAKRAKTSNKNLLDEIENVIQRRVQTVIKESFDQKIQDLSRQINLIQCKQVNKDILAKHLRGIRRLGRHLTYALKVQNEAGTQSSKVPSVGCTLKALPKTDAADKNFADLPPEQTSSRTENSSVQNLSADCSHLVVLSDNETEQQSDQGQTERPKYTSKKVDHSALQKIMESIKEHRNKTLSSKAEKPAAVIDLTDDEQKANGDATYLSSQTTSSCPASAPEVLKDENLSQKSSEKIEMLSENNIHECSYATEKTPSDQKSGKTGDSVAHLEISPNFDLQMLKPPQKPELRLAQVQNPKGIALSWNITHADPSCAPPEFYCLYVHQENPNNSKKLWKKIGEIKALPLPMACTLTQFVDDATYSFVLRAKDACGRFGPLCDIQSTTLKFLVTPKKS